MSAAHTPGPWRHKPVYGPGRVELLCDEIVAADGQTVIASVDQPENVPIVTAAPELLEALHLVDAMFSMPGKVNKQSVRDKVRAAIAKAEGRQ